VAEEAFFVDSKTDIGGDVAFGGASAFQTQQEPKFDEIASDEDLPF
jgi:hypothetical protein